MKKIILIVGIVLGQVSVGFCANPQPHNIGTVRADAVVLVPQTLTQIDALTPDDTNQVVVCTNCKFALCISTGAQSLARGGFVVVGSTIPAASSGNAQPLHCQ